MAAPEEVKYGLDLAGLDPAALAEALAQAARELARHPGEVARAVGELALAQAAVGLDVARTALGASTDPVAAPDPDDRRFTDRAWTDNPFLRGLLESYLLNTRSALDTLDSLDLPPATKRKARFALGLVLDAAAPTNVPWLNPTVVKEAVDTGGLSLARGFANFLGDLVRNGGRPTQVDTTPFEVGRTLAATPGRVVMRNDLAELIAYEPQTEKVFAQPLVYSPPWINKYYVLDLSPGRSFVEYAGRRGFTVFAISYRNPDASMAEVSLDHYLRDGLLASLERASELTGSPRVNVLGVCIGGTLTTMALAVLAARGEADRVGWTTLLNTLVDFGDPGDIAVFTDEAAIERIEKRITRRGYTRATELSDPFTWMKGNDLIWRYVVANWYMGKPPPAFDVLAWNADSTNLPAAMHAQFLRACYLRNALVEPGAFAIGGVPVDVSKIETPLYVLGSETDHIAPWRSTFRTTQLVGGEARYVLTSGGHIVGMVNPPGNPKAWYRADGDVPGPDEWLGSSELRPGSWWDDWADWAAQRSGDLVDPPSLPPGEAAPGRYVRGRA